MTNAPRVERQEPTSLKDKFANPANWFTAARLPLGLAGMIMYVTLSPFWGVVVIAAAAMTDYFDGTVARRLNRLTEFGRKFDPIVDKVFMIGVLCFALATVSDRTSLFVLVVLGLTEASIAVTAAVMYKRLGHEVRVVIAGKIGILGRMSAVGLFLLATVPSISSLSRAFNEAGLILGTVGFVCGAIAGEQYANQR